MTEAFDKPLTVPLLVRGGVTNSPRMVLIAPVAILVILAALVANRSGTTIPILLWGGLLVSLGLLYLVAFAVQYSRRRWLQITLSGFIVSERDGATTISDEQVISLTHQRPARNRTTHRLSLEIDQDGRTRMLECTYTQPDGASDPLEGLRERLVRAIAGRGRERLATEGLEGDGWRVDEQGMHQRGRSVEWSQICKVGYFDRKLCVWKDEDERPFLKLPESDRNVLPLGVLLGEELRVSPVLEAPLPGRPLGRLLFERIGTDLILLLIGLLGLFATLVAALFLLPKFVPGDPNAPGHRVAQVLTLTCAGAGGALLFGLRRFRFHEHGIARTGLFGPRHLLFDEVGTLYHFPGGSLMLLTQSRQSMIAYAPILRSRDEDVALLRDQVARLLAQRWLEQLAEGPVSWTARLRFLPGSLEFHEGGLFGSGEPATLPYRMLWYEVSATEFLLYEHGRPKPVCREYLAVANFYPGLMLLKMLDERLTAEREEKEPAAAEEAGSASRNVMVKPGGRRYQA